MSRVTPILWYGNKNGMVETILSLMPPHKTYVEAFGGAAAVLLGKPPSTVEVYNDKDKSLHEFFLLLKNPEKARLLRHRLELTPYSLDVYKDYVARFDTIDDEIERAVAFVVIANQSFNGKFGAGWKRSKERNCASSYYKALKLIETAARRLQNVQVDNLDFEDLIRRYDATDTLFLLDPPYLPDTRVTTKAYRHEMSIDDHKRLLKAVNEVKGMVMLCGYSHPLYEEALVGWERHERIVNCCSATLAKPGTDKTRTEVIWLNPRAAEARRLTGGNRSEADERPNSLR